MGTRSKQAQKRRMIAPKMHLYIVYDRTMQAADGAMGVLGTYEAVDRGVARRETPEVFGRPQAELFVVSVQYATRREVDIALQKDVERSANAPTSV